jgi:hypothetical protein
MISAAIGALLGRDQKFAQAEKAALAGSALRFRLERHAVADTREVGDALQSKIATDGEQ